MHIWTFIYDKDGIKNNGERMAFDSGSTGNPYRKGKIFQGITRKFNKKMISGLGNLPMGSGRCLYCRLPHLPLGHEECPCNRLPHCY